MHVVNSTKMPKKYPLGVKVYQVLKQRIISGLIPAGAQIRINALAAELQVSSTPVRDAVSQLESEGLVEVRPRSGVYVTLISDEDVKEIYQIRLLIEPEVARSTAAHVSASWLRRAEEIVMQLASIDAQKLYTDYASFQQSIDLDIEFHLHIISAMENRRLMAFYRNLNAHWRLARVLYFMSDERAVGILAEHELILKAFLQGNGELAGDVLRDHLRHARELHFKRLSEVRLAGESVHV